MALGLYVHIPFCSAICNYCNFNRGLFDGDLKNQYVAALLQEIRSKADRRRRRHDLLRRRHAVTARARRSRGRSSTTCRDAFAVSADAEVTLEANPETVTRERLEGFRAAGVNRLSFGVQSFRDEELQRLSRLHSASRAREAFAMAREAGFDNVSLDLMMWLPAAVGRRLARARWRGSSSSVLSTRRSTCWRSTPTRPCATRWREDSGRSRPTKMRQRCICRPWQSLDAPGTSSTRSPTSPGQAASRGIT